jgi:hypothetical protein
MHYMRFDSVDNGIETWRCPFCARTEIHDLWEGTVTVEGEGDIQATGHNIYLRVYPEVPMIKLPEPFATWAEAHGIR